MVISLEAFLWLEIQFGKKTSWGGMIRAYTIITRMEKVMKKRLISVSPVQELGIINQITMH